MMPGSANYGSYTPPGSFVGQSMYPQTFNGRPPMSMMNSMKMAPTNMMMQSMPPMMPSMNMMPSMRPPMSYGGMPMGMMPYGGMPAPAFEMEPEFMERVIEIPRINVEHNERLIEVPQPQVVDRIVEVPQVQEIVREVAGEVETRFINYEIPVLEYHEHVPPPREEVQVQYQDRYVEVPQIQEVVRVIPRIEVREIPIERIIQVPKKVIQEIEQPIFRPVPHLIEMPVEREIPIPRVQVQQVEVVKQISHPVDQVVDVAVPNPVPIYDLKPQTMMMQEREVPVPVPVPTEVERIVEVPRVEEKIIERTVEVPVPVPGPVETIEKTVEVPMTIPAPVHVVAQPVPVVQRVGIMTPPTPPAPRILPPVTTTAVAPTQYLPKQTTVLQQPMISTQLPVTTTVPRPATTTYAASQPYAQVMTSPLPMATQFVGAGTVTLSGNATPPMAPPQIAGVVQPTSARPAYAQAVGGYRLN